MSKAGSAAAGFHGGLGAPLFLPFALPPWIAHGSMDGCDTCLVSYAQGKAAEAQELYKQLQQQRQSDLEQQPEEGASF